MFLDKGTDIGVCTGCMCQAPNCIRRIQSGVHQSPRDMVHGLDAIIDRRSSVVVAIGVVDEALFYAVLFDYKSRSNAFALCVCRQKLDA